jgi:AcrR family transcriptional regulator
MRCRRTHTLPATPTTPKGIRTRRHILDAARRVFDRDGFVRASMLDIAEESALSLGAVYRYFENKERLFEVLIGDIHEELYAASRAPHARFATEPFAALLEANYGYLSHYRANRDVMRTLIEAANVDRFFRDIWWKMRARHTERFIAALDEAHDVREIDGVAVTVAADAVACMVEQAAYVWYAHEDLHGGDVPVETAAQIVTRAWYRLFFGAGADGELGPDDAQDFLSALSAGGGNGRGRQPDDR